MTVTTSPSAGGNAVDKGGNAQVPPNPDHVGLTIDGVPVSVPWLGLVTTAFSFSLFMDGLHYFPRREEMAGQLDDIQAG